MQEVKTAMCSDSIKIQINIICFGKIWVSKKCRWV